MIPVTARQVRTARKQLLSAHRGLALNPDDGRLLKQRTHAIHVLSFGRLLRYRPRLNGRLVAVGRPA